MKRSDIPRIAAEADAYADKVLSPGEFHPNWHEVRDEKFALLAAAAEREYIARVVERAARPNGEELWFTKVLVECAAAIRARGEK